MTSGAEPTHHRLLPKSAHPDAARVLLAQGLRAFGDGFVSVLLPAYLLALGLTPLQIGIIATTALLGSAAMTLAIGFAGARASLRTLLLGAAILMAVTGLGFAAFASFWPLLLLAAIGTINPSSGSASMFAPLEHTLLTRTVADEGRTALFARYSLVGAVAGAIGTLFAASPDLLTARFGLSPLAGFQAMFVLYAAIGTAAAMAYRRIAPWRAADGEAARSVLGPSRRIVYRLAALFSIDSFGGGFVVQSILALWLFQRFELSLATAASIFFWSNVLAALSYLAAAAMARRIGLINTMVFTHLPANLCLVAIPFMSDLRVVIALLLVRSLLSQMDVPARTSYVMAVVTPAERPAAASITAVPRSLAAAASPTLAGSLLSLTSFGWPLLAGGLLKIAYDLALLAMFRHVRPPEERPQR